MGSINKEAQKCLIDSATTHSILSCKSFFTQLKPMKANLHTIAGSTNMIEGSGTACVIFQKEQRSPYKTHYIQVKVKETC
jgi:hypothetical protein